jgi:hypothetical protein
MYVYSTVNTRKITLYVFFGGLERVGHSFADFAFLRDVWIRTQSAAVASRRAIPTHLPLMGSGNSKSSQLESNILLSF